jgi:hypothetical protein
LPSASRTLAVADLVFDPRHAAPIDGATRAGEARGGNGLLVRLGLWLGADGRVERARYRATTCASLIAFAEVACALLEGGLPPDHLTPAALGARLAGVHPGHLDRAELVVAAARAAAAGWKVTAA